MKVTRGARLPAPKDIQSLLGRQVYWNTTPKILADWNSNPATLSILDITPHKLYTILSIDSTEAEETTTSVQVTILDDSGDSCGILLGNITCAYLGNQSYWSLKQLTRKQLLAEMHKEAKRLEEQKTNG